MSTAHFFTASAVSLCVLAVRPKLTLAEGSLEGADNKILRASAALCETSINKNKLQVIDLKGFVISPGTL